ncbi:MAG: LamG domain-containing protein [Deinococcus sp.]|nr:LamG domain-containing protein [Deinococcus sp.]
MQTDIVTLTALSLLLGSAALAQGAQPEAKQTAPATQQGLIYSTLTPAAGKTMTITLPVAAGTAARVGSLKASGAGGTLTAQPSVKGGVATYSVTFPADGIYTLSVAGLPEQRIRVGGERLSSPLLHLDFDDAAAPLKDLSGLGHAGRAVGTLNFVPGVRGQGLSFANEGSYVEFPHTAALDTPGEDLTMSLWLRPNDERNYSDFFTKGDWNVLKTDSRNNSISFFTGGWRRGETEAAQPDDWDGKWHHLVGVVRGQEARLYIDGELVNQTELEGKLGWTPHAWNLGRNAEAPEGRGFKGVLDDVRLYPFALTDSEVEQLFEEGQ